MNILITGHLGFVGRSFIRHFKDAHTVVGIDLKEGNDCREFFKKSTQRFDLVIHLAAIVGGRETIENEPLSVATDLSIDSEFFNWVVKTKQPRVVYFSSSAAYPVHLQSPELKYRLRESDIDLNDIRLPDYTYGWSKLTGEYLAKFVREQGTKVYVFRPFSGYGADQDLTYPFPSFVNRIKTKVPQFEIWGDGTQVRDFIHMEDIVKAVMTVVDNDIQVDALNLGSGIATSFNELAESMFTISGWVPRDGIKHLLYKPIGVSYRVCDPTLMLSIYKPKYTLEERIEQILNYTTAL
jgi:nucleoside-diphosphate-sugar epimerase